VKYAFVVPRYGREVVGGAELGARMLAERLVSQLGWSVEVYTTRALDHMTWADQYPAGDETVGGVVVHRLSSASGRPPRFFPFSERVLSHPEAATLAEAEEFLTLQGPTSPELYDAVASSDAELIAFYPYLYTTTARALPRVAGRALMHPAAHDEPALHLPVFRSVFRSVQGLVFQTWSERRLVQGLFAVGQLPQVVVGLGFEGPDREPSPAETEAARHRAGGRPYLLSLGRVDGFKGTTMLAGFFAAYKERHPGPLQLVLAGPVTAVPPPHPDIVVTGPVSDTEKWALLSGAEVFVQPSPHEAFSIVLTEAWSRARPVVVNGRCQATREHCERSGGGLWFESYAQFEAVLERLLADERLRLLLGRRGKAFVEANFRWPTIVERYGRFVTSLRERIG
jgi:glycosyltransferase involved in cell wall biosynthesis